MKKIVSHIAVLGVGEFLARTAGFFSTVYIARVLGTESYGLYSFILAIHAFAAFAANPNLDTIGTRELSRAGGTPGGIPGAVFALRTALSVLVFGIVCAAGFLLFASSVLRTLLVIQTLTVLLTPFMLQYIHIAYHRPLVVSISKILQSMVFLVLCLCLIRSADDLVLLPWLNVVSLACALLPLWLWRGGMLPVPSLRTDAATVRSLARSSMYLGTSGLLILIYVGIDTVFLGFLRPASEVGCYAAAYKFVAILSILPSLVLTAFLPLLAKTADTEEYVSHLRSYITALFVAGIPIGFAGYFAAEWLLTSVFGAAYSQGTTPLRILLFNGSFIYINMAFANPLTAWGKEKEYLFTVGTGAVVNLAANALLIPLWGMVGAAIATVGAELGVLIVAAIMFRRYCPVQIELAFLLPCVGWGITAFFCGMAVSTALNIHPLLESLIVVTIAWIPLLIRRSDRELYTAFLRVRAGTSSVHRGGE